MARKQNESSSLRRAQQARAGGRSRPARPAPGSRPALSAVADLALRLELDLLLGRRAAFLRRLRRALNAARQAA